ncbi:MAG TPA: thioester reductase domain-containing protein, partial [Streptosporangiaceae bacterium]
APDYVAVTPRRPPRSPLETALCELVGEVLGVAEVGADDSFFDLGGHSMLVTRLVWLISQRLRVLLPVRAVFERNTVAGLASLLEASEGSEPAITIADLMADVTLDPAITTEGRKPPVPNGAGPDGILLTGATGFFGSFILREALNRTTARVFCLVRAADSARAMDRLRQSLERYGLWEPKLQDRIVPVPGDLAEPMLGLDSDRFDELAEQVQVIYHNGARVNHLESYAQLRKANVTGVQEIYRLAARHQVKPVHLVSSSSTIVAGRGDPDVLPEDWVSDPALLGPSGYARSKWVAEGISRIAQARGIPTAIYRPTRISGHSVTGAAGYDDALWHYVRACIELGARPIPEDDNPNVGNLVPVDFAAAAFVHLALTQPASGTVYSLAAPVPFDFDALLDHAHDMGYRMRLVPAADWLELLKGATARAPISERSSLHAALLLNGDTGASEEAPEARYPHEFDRRNLIRGTGGAKIDCLPISPELLDRYFAFFVNSGYLPQVSPGASW